MLEKYFVVDRKSVKKSNLVYNVFFYSILDRNKKTYEYNSISVLNNIKDNWKRVNERKETKQKLQFPKYKIFIIEAVWFSKTINHWHFFDKINRIWENWINLLNFNSPEESGNWNSISKLEIDHAFVTFTLMLFNSGVCLPFKNRKWTERNRRSNRVKSNLAWEIFRRFPGKSHKKQEITTTYKRVFAKFVGCQSFIRCLNTFCRINSSLNKSYQSRDALYLRLCIWNRPTIDHKFKLGILEKIFIQTNTSNVFFAKIFFAWSEIFSFS